MASATVPCNATIRAGFVFGAPAGMTRDAPLRARRIAPGGEGPQRQVERGAAQPVDRSIGALLVVAARVDSTAVVARQGGERPFEIRVRANHGHGEAFKLLESPDGKTALRRCRHGVSITVATGRSGCNRGGGAYGGRTADGIELSA